MKQLSPRIWTKTLERLWREAESSVRNELPDGYVEVVEEHLRELWEDFERTERRKAVLGQKLKAVLEDIRQEDPTIPPPTHGVINAKNLARLLGETGPLGDFGSWRRLMRYAGLNIRMRSSGKHAGKNRISKKGRVLLRKVLDQIALSLVKRGNLYGQYYHKKVVPVGESL